MLVRVSLATIMAALACAVTLTALELAQVAAAPSKGPPPPDANGPPTTWKSVPRVARVRVDVAPGGAAVLHDIVFPKDAIAVLGAGDPTLFVAFTAQARPLAVEATKYALGAGDVIDETTPEKLQVIDVPQRPKTAAMLLGPAAQAGHVIRVPRDAAPFAVRVRSAIATHEVENPTRMITVMARLGLRDATPMPLASIEVGSVLDASIRGARATLCGTSSDPRPLAVVFPGYPANAPSGAASASSSSPDAGTLPPALANRSATDDLCIDVLL